MDRSRAREHNNGAYAMRTKILGLLAVGLLAGPVVSQAVPITVSAGQSFLWNFDVSDQMPPPPYTIVNWFANVAYLTADDDGLWTLFTDLDGGGDAGTLNLFQRDQSCRSNWFWAERRAHVGSFDPYIRLVKG